MKVREGGRMVKNQRAYRYRGQSDGYRELVGMQVATKKSVES